jgi:hypothetical protein
LVHLDPQLEKLGNPYDLNLLQPWKTNMLKQIHTKCLQPLLQHAMLQQQHDVLVDLKESVLEWNAQAASPNLAYQFLFAQLSRTFHKEVTKLPPWIQALATGWTPLILEREAYQLNQPSTEEYRPAARAAHTLTTVVRDVPFNPTPIPFSRHPIDKWLFGFTPSNPDFKPLGIADVVPSEHDFKESVDERIRKRPQGVPFRDYVDAEKQAAQMALKASLDTFYPLFVRYGLLVLANRWQDKTDLRMPSLSRRYFTRTFSDYTDVLSPLLSWAVNHQTAISDAISHLHVTQEEVIEELAIQWKAVQDALKNFICVELWTCVMQSFSLASLDLLYNDRMWSTMDGILFTLDEQDTTQKRLVLEEKGFDLNPFSSQLIAPFLEALNHVDTWIQGESQLRRGAYADQNRWVKWTKTVTPKGDTKWTFHFEKKEFDLFIEKTQPFVRGDIPFIFEKEYVKLVKFFGEWYTSVKIRLPMPSISEFNIIYQSLAQELRDYLHVKKWPLTKFFAYLLFSIEMISVQLNVNES